MNKVSRLPVKSVSDYCPCRFRWEHETHAGGKAALNLTRVSTSSFLKRPT